MKCKEKTPVIDAYRWGGEEEQPQWVTDAIKHGELFFFEGELYIEVDFRTIPFSDEDYIIRNEYREISRCWGPAFEDVYEIVEED